jgi:hypothetical protein
MEVVGCVARHRYFFDLRVVVIGHPKEPVIRLYMRCVFPSPFLAVSVGTDREEVLAVPDLSHFSHPTS